MVAKISTSVICPGCGYIMNDEEIRDDKTILRCVYPKCNNINKVFISKIPTTIKMERTI